MELILSRKIIGKTIINSDILTVWHRGVCLAKTRKIIGKTIINSDILTVWHRGVCLAKTSAAFRHCGAAVAALQTFALRARAPQPSTRHEKDNKNNTENQTESAAARVFY